MEITCKYDLYLAILCALFEFKYDLQRLGIKRSWLESPGVDSLSVDQLLVIFMINFNIPNLYIKPKYSKVGW